VHSCILEIDKNTQKYKKIHKKYKKNTKNTKKYTKNTKKYKKIQKNSPFFIINLIIEKIKLLFILLEKFTSFYNTFKTLTNW